MLIELHAKYFVHIIKANYKKNLIKLYQNNLSLQKIIESGQAIRKKQQDRIFFSGIERCPICY